MVSLSFSESQCNTLLGLVLGVAWSLLRMGLLGARPTFPEPTGAMTPCQPPWGVPAHPCQLQPHASRMWGAGPSGSRCESGSLNSLVVGGVPSITNVSHQWGVFVSIIHLPELSPLRDSTSQAALSP